MRPLIKAVICLAQIIPLAYGRAIRLNVGAVFEKNSLDHLVFNFAIDALNEQYKADLWLQPYVEFIRPYPLEQPDQKVCSLLQHGVVAVFGPADQLASARIESVCAKMAVPYIKTVAQIANVSLRPLVVRFCTPVYLTLLLPFSVNLHPSTRTIGSALADVISYYEWPSFVLLYENDRDLADLQDIVHLSSRSRSLRVRVRQLPPNGDYRAFLKHIKSTYAESRFVIHCRLAMIEHFLRQVAELRMVIHHYSYIFTHADLHTVNIQPFQTECNITGISLFDWSSQSAKKLSRDLRTYFKGQYPLARIGIQSLIPLMYDSVSVLIETLRRPLACFTHYCDALKDSLHTRALICDAQDTWNYGRALLNTLRRTKIRGITGPVEFDDVGNRRKTTLTIIENTKSGFEELATWSRDAGLEPKDVQQLAEPVMAQTLENKTLRVTVQIEEPFVMYKRDAHLHTGNARFQGYSIDLLDWIAQHNKFRYILHEVKDGTYGAETSGKWNGMVGELVRGEADLAVSAMTISYSRSEVIDFTVPFMHLGISILFKRPKKEEGPELFNFLRPLSFGLWLYLLVAYLIVSLSIWFLARFSPYEWFNPHPQDKRRDSATNQFTILNSLWFSVGSLMQQGSDVSPKAVSTRIIAAVWWFFTVILISSYTAKLAAFLTVARMSTPIENADDLAKQEKVKYGTLSSGSTMTFFKESRISTYERMWVFMDGATPSVFVNNSKEGIARVKAGEYAYLMESSMLEYYAERDCDLIQIGGLIDSKGYGIALRKGSTFRTALSRTILMLQESTQLESLKNKWWSSRERGGGRCHNFKSNDNPPIEGARKLKNIGGIFLVLSCGLGLAFIIALMEFIYKMKTDPTLAKLSLCTAIMHEIRFAIQGCRTLTHFDHSRRHQMRRTSMVALFNENLSIDRPRRGLGSRTLDEPLLNDERVCLTGAKARDSEFI